MKTIIWIPLFLFFAVSTSAQEQSQRKGNPAKSYDQRMQNSTPEQRAEMRTKRMTEQLSLTEEQQKKVFKITLDQINTQRNFQTQNKGQAEERRKEFIKNREELESILNPVQKEKWNKIQKDIMSSRKERTNDKGSRYNRSNMKQRGKMVKQPDSVKAKIKANKNIPVGN